MQEFLVIGLVGAWIAIIVNLMLTLALLRRYNDDATENLLRKEEQNSILTARMLATNNIAPDFEAKTMEGDILTLQDFANQRFIFTFISASCIPCSQFLNEVNRLKEKLEKSKLKLVFISLSDAEITQDFIKDKNLTGPILIAPQTTNNLSVEYQIPGTPSGYLIGENQEILWGGFLDAQRLEFLLANWG